MLLFTHCTHNCLFDTVQLTIWKLTTTNSFHKTVLLMKTLAIVMQSSLSLFVFYFISFFNNHSFIKEAILSPNLTFFQIFFKDADTDRRANCSPSDYSSQTSDTVKLIFKNKHYYTAFCWLSRQRSCTRLEVIHSNGHFQIWQDVYMKSRVYRYRIPPSRLTGHPPSEDIQRFAFL